MNEFTTIDGRFTLIYDNPKAEISTRLQRGKKPLLAEAHPNLAAWLDGLFDDDVTAESLDISELTGVIEGLGFDQASTHSIAADILTALA